MLEWLLRHSLILLDQLIPICYPKNIEGGIQIKLITLLNLGKYMQLILLMELSFFNIKDNFQYNMIKFLPMKILRRLES
jgi:hypothetical protein